MREFIKDIQKYENKKQMEMLDLEIEYLEEMLKDLRKERKRVYLREYYLKKKEEKSKTVDR